MNRSFTVLLAVTTLAGLALRLTRLGSQSLWIDEILSIDWIQAIRDHGWSVLLKDIHGPLHAVLLYGVAQISTSEWWLRLPSALAGAVSIPALGLLGRAVWGPRIGLTCAVLLAGSPFALYYAQECRNYAFTMLFAILSMTAAYGFTTQPTTRRAVLLATSLLFGIASNLNGLFFGLGLSLWVVWRLWQKKRLLVPWVLTHLVLAVVLLPYGLEISRQVRPERLVGVETGFGQNEPLRGQKRLHPLAIPYTGFAFATGYSLGPTLAELRQDRAAASRPRHLPVLVLVAVGFGLAFVAGLGARAGSVGLVLAPALVTLGFTVWLAASNMKPFNVRYLSVLLPGFWILVAQGLWFLPRRVGRVAALAIGIVSLVSSYNYLFVPAYGRDDVRGVVDYVADQAASRDAVVQVSLTGPLGYYDRLGGRALHPPFAAFRSVETARRYLEDSVGDAPTVWYLECRSEGIDPGGHLLAALGSGATRVSTRSFVGIRVHRVERSPATDY